MLPDWDRDQDLRRHGEQKTKPWPLRGTKPDEPTPAIERAVSDAADRVTAERVVRGIVRDRTMSILGKMAHLTETAQDFHKETEGVLDGIAGKIATARQRRDQAAAKHHAYYDTIIKGVDESTEVIDRLSNGPLSGAGGSYVASDKDSA